MCKINDDCDAIGRRQMVGRQCKACRHVLRKCSDCGNEYVDTDDSIPFKDCPNCDN